MPTAVNDQGCGFPFTGPQSSPTYDVRVLQCLLTTKKVPQQLSLLCIDAPEVSQGQTIRFI